MSKWNDGKFHHFAFVQDDGERRIYVDGKLDGTSPVTYPLAAASGNGGLWLGNEGAPPWSCDGGYVCGGNLKLFAFRARTGAAYKAGFVPEFAWKPTPQDFVLWYVNSASSVVATSPGVQTAEISAVGVTKAAGICPQP